MQRSKTVDRSSYAGSVAFSLGLGKARDLARGVALSLGKCTHSQEKGGKDNDLSELHDGDLCLEK